MKPTVKACDECKEYHFKLGCYILEMSNDESDPSASIARARIGPGQTTQWYMLKDTVERYVILEGKGLVSVGEDLVQEVKPGDVVIIPPETRQRIQNTGENELVFLAVCTPRFQIHNCTSLGL